MTETEATLVVLSEPPEALVREVSDLRRLGAYALTPRGPEVLQDTYFDTLEGGLKRQRAALRIREVAGAFWVALKGPPRPTRQNVGQTRLELEGLWGPGILSAIAGRVNAMGVPFAPPALTGESASPVAEIQKAGMVVIQNRTVVRLPREVRPEGAASSPPLAELVVDRVDFRLGERVVKHHELEVETKSVDGRAVIADVVAALLETFGDSLAVYEHGKLTTGKALESLDRRGDLAALLDSEGNLRPEAYDQVRAVLRED